MTPKRDVDAFDARAAGYEDGWLGRLHRDIADRAAALAVATVPAPRRVLDVGCGTGYLLRALAGAFPDVDRLDGVDPAPSMVAVATASAQTGRLRCRSGVAEHLPYPDDTFDLVATVTSFDHWEDQRAGLAECARVLRPGGALVLVDQFSPWSLWSAPTLWAGRRGRARTVRRCTRLLQEAGFRSPVWHPVSMTLIKAVTAHA
ncbi:MAG TPA: class I SAM-dependent methyltransferase [Acidimicrobiales bacterium]|nr:class I SAM-dependent methyltransferase [Acidimicrobiales bacterium]